MRILPVSDLHFEFHADHGTSLIDELEKNVEVLIVAGDLAESNGILDALSRLGDAFPHVVYVPGNHDWFKADRTSIEELRARVEKQLSNVHWLDRNVVEVDGQRFVGTTLWFRDTPTARRWTKNMPDFSEIRDFNEWIWSEFERDRSFLEEIIEPGDVVITHHLPTRTSIADRWINDALNCYFVGNVEDLVKDKGARWWIHGHTHESCDHMLGRTRVLCNPFGYPKVLNRDFRPNLIVEV